MPLPARSTREKREAVIVLVYKVGELQPREAELLANMLSGFDDTGGFLPVILRNAPIVMIGSTYTATCHKCRTGIFVLYTSSIYL